MQEKRFRLSGNDGAKKKMVRGGSAESVDYCQPHPTASDRLLRSFPWAAARTPALCGCPIFLRPDFSLEVEQFAQAAGLRAADGDFRLLLIVHAQLVGAFEPWHHFADVVDVDQE